MCFNVSHSVKDVYDHEGCWHAAAEAGRPVNLQCKVIAARSSALVAGYVDGGTSPAEGDDPTRGVRRGERERLAAHVCTRVAVYWRREDIHDSSVSPTIYIQS